MTKSNQTLSHATVTAASQPMTLLKTTTGSKTYEFPCGLQVQVMNSDKSVFWSSDWSKVADLAVSKAQGFSKKFDRSSYGHTTVYFTAQEVVS